MVLKSFFFIYPLLIILSIIGFGKLFTKFFKNHLNLDLAVVSIFGFFFLFIISFISHLFVHHGYLHNVILLIIGAIFKYFREINK